MTAWTLFGTFFYIGLFTIGGGQVAITLMYQSLVESGIIEADFFYNMVAVSESTPGPIGINMATYLGCELFGIWGGIITTLGTVTPSVIIIIIIARYFGKVQDTALVKNLFSTLRPVAAGMVFVAAWNVFSISVLLLPAALKSGLWHTALDPIRIFFWLVFCILLFKTKLPPVLYIAAGAVLGILFL